MNWVQCSEEYNTEFSTLTQRAATNELSRLSRKSLEAEKIKDLESRHHSKWSDARAEHIARNVELVQHRIQSLLASGKARCQLLEDQINAATNEKIALMKQRELASAKRDGSRRLGELEKSSDIADIHAKQVVVGVLRVKAGVAS